MFVPSGGWEHYLDHIDTAHIKETEMSIQEFMFEGKIAWAQVYTPKQFNPKEAPKYLLNFYPKDAAERKAVLATGIKNKVKEDDGEKSGVEGLFFVFRTEVKPTVTDAEGVPLTALIGNGSSATVRLSVENFTSPTYGKQARSNLTGVVVTTLIPYVRPETELPASELPA